MPPALRRCGWILPLLLIGLLPLTVRAESDAGSAPISFPDASVDEGGADRDQQEGQDSTGRVVTSCSSSVECNPGFQCEDRRCTWRGIRKAEGGFGCGGMVASTLLLPLFAAGWLRRSFRRLPSDR